jgi:DNA-binding NarL/FixJ family response regulator
MASSSLDNPIRILLVDDHLLVREGLRELIESRPGMVVVGDTGSGAKAVSIASSTHPDIIILDLDLGDEDGLAALPKLINTASQSSIIILTGERDPDKRDKAIELGAKGVVLKENGATELLSAIEKVYHTGEYWLETGAMNRLLNKRKPIAEKPDPNASKIASLTEREREIIALVGEGLENKEIAARLRPVVAEATVRNNLSIIYEKLGIKNGRLGLLVYAYKEGLVSNQAR